MIQLNYRFREGPDSRTGSRIIKFTAAFGVVLVAILLSPVWAQEDEYAEARAALTRELRSYAKLDRPGGGSGLSEGVLQVMATVKRHEFVPERSRGEAYGNYPLPIGYGQTISQPYIVALMTDLLALEPDDMVLEVGTGSGYQAAALAELVDRVFSIEIVEPLAIQVEERLARLGYNSITTRLGDGYFGWEEFAPFDAIIVTAAASKALGIVYRAIATHLTHKAGFTPTTAKTGAVTLIQRFGSAGEAQGRFAEGKKPLERSR